ncbi:amino acid permease [Tumebacillus permanentifrigoris]|uniref:Amino acid/polyamine/organocation transporter (APC superfamily) n=1 Tax=Tumebacillus permanentifrigoris TaxID=378543 RepID=A0A316DBW1_9BACL|nr:amino acid permease [Tumebacillus permanentifrigoris]PWK14849.1 amino acid/polyamine/organocation transporter (APC superfamily) [Tumebacillus permanentifrigoris]
MNFFRKKNIDAMISGAQSGSTLKKSLGTWDLVMMGIGAIIGTGIFVLTGKGALTAGPALIISFLVAGFACALCGLAYAEFASTIPVSGSVYTYTYASIGELFAWMIGWDLVLEYTLALSLVAVGWSGYFQSLIKGLTGFSLPTALTAAPGAVPGSTTYFNLSAALIILLITFLLSRGVRESARINNLMVIVKLGVILLFVLVGAKYVRPENWQPFAPFGFGGIVKSAAVMFTAFIGFDIVSSAAEETRDPGRQLPRGILYSLLICVVLYVTVSLVMTGIVPFAQFAGVDHPVSLALQVAGQNWVAGFIDVGAILGMTTVLLVVMFGQTRIFYSMSRDGLLPKMFSKVDAKRGTPVRSTWFSGIVAAVLGGLISLDRLAELINIGTLAAFAMVSVCVLVLRKTRPDLPRKFRCPGVPYLPLLAIACCLYLMSQLERITWIAFFIWLAIGLVVYLTYSRHRSVLGKDPA